VVIPGGWEGRFEGDPDDPVLHAFSHVDPELTQLVLSLIAEWKPQLNDWLGAETREDEGILISQLENAYRVNYLGDNEDGMFGVPDHNHMIVAEALRIKLLPSACIKAEFDDTIPTFVRQFDVVQTSTYRKELKRIRKMTDEQRTAFNHTLMRIRGHEPAEGGGVYVQRASCGDKVSGFAIDPVSLETMFVYQFGLHHAVGEMLADRIRNIDALVKRKRFGDMTEDEERDCRWRLITGLIFAEVDGFTTPILQLYGMENDPGHLARVARFLKDQQKFIPVDYEGKIMEG
jgi:hypothetical protein